MIFMILSVLRSIRQYGTRFAQFHKEYKNGRRSYPTLDFCDRETIWREMQDFSNKLDFLAHPLQKLQLFPQHLCKFNLLEDGRAGISSYVSLTIVTNRKS